MSSPPSPESVPASASSRWIWAATTIIFIAIMWLSTAPMRLLDEETALGPTATRFAQAPGFDEVAQIVRGRCSMCHAEQPVWPGLYLAPKGVVLETDAQIASQARSIYLQSGLSHAMAPANLTWLEDRDRAAIRAWYRAASRG